MMAAEVTGKVKGVIVTMKGSTENGAVSSDGEAYDFVSRYFAPWNGIPEDPVTGLFEFFAIPVFIDCENMIFLSEIAITRLKKTRISLYLCINN